MQNLAEKMADDYCEQLFWPSMEIIAGEILSFPKVKNKRHYLSEMQFGKYPL